MPAAVATNAKAPLSSYAEGILSNYTAEFADDAADSTGADFTDAFQRVREQLDSAQSSAAVCLICLDTMGNDDAIWHCSRGCCCVLHLLCVQAWSRQQIAANAYKASVDSGRDSSPQQPSWACPKCRAAYQASEVPTEYRCFCGKQQDPPVDPWLAPHTCGDICGKELASGCGHTCVLLCHPGPCPPCPRQIVSACHCGKLSKPVRCSQSSFSCGKLCGKRLPCGHRCPHKCHTGECPACTLSATVSCHCGAETKTLPCSQRDLHCDRVCGKALPCGRHRCERVCHGGPCGECPMEGPRLCPCGKVEHETLACDEEAAPCNTISDKLLNRCVPVQQVEYENLACDEEAAPCGSTCDKLLPCGRHHCAERCHHGPCTTLCRALVDKECSCGKTHKVVQCHETLRCEKKCSNMKACGRHQCRRRCCDGDCPPCDLPCGRRLRCGNHKCPAPCHSGLCLPCPLTSTVSCACGKTSYKLPCGSEGRAIAPKCQEMCPVRPTCRHADSRPAHRCHWGPCPPCSQFCGTPLPCDHACSAASCHDKPPPAIPPFTPPDPPASATFAATHPLENGSAQKDSTGLSPAAQVAKAAEDRQEGFLTDCPPCQAPVPTPCLGGHTTKPLPCHQAAPFSCGAACGQPLSCGNHTCSKPCHVLPGGDLDTARSCEQCTQPCQKPRGCEHGCPLPCHPGPCPACTEERQEACHCGRSFVTVQCDQLQQASKADRLKLLCCGKPCHKALPKCPHVCQASCHQGPCPAASGKECEEEVTVRCPCRRRKTKMPCHQVQRKLKANEGTDSYTDATPLRLLPCDQACKDAKGKKQEADDASNRETPEAVLPPSEQSKSIAASTAVTEPGADKGIRRRNRAERAALQQQQELQQQQQAKQEWRWLILCRSLQGLLAVAFAVVAFVAFWRML